MNTLTTTRLLLRPFTLEDADFILEITNDPDFVHFIGNKNINCLPDARQYLVSGPLDSYMKHRFGLMAVIVLSTGKLIGMCGLVKRSFLSSPDLGFAFLPGFRKLGFAGEAAEAVLLHSFRDHNMKKILAITKPENDSSIKLLVRLGFNRTSPVHDEEGTILECFEVASTGMKISDPR